MLLLYYIIQLYMNDGIKAEGFFLLMLFFFFVMIKTTWQTIESYQSTF